MRNGSETLRFAPLELPWENAGMRRFLTACLFAFTLVALPVAAQQHPDAGRVFPPETWGNPFTIQQIYDGGGVGQGMQAARDFRVNTDGNPRQVVIDILFGVLSFMALVAVVVIIIAGIILVVRGEEEEWRTKARNMVVYAIIGLLVIFVSSAIVAIASSLTN